MMRIVLFATAAITVLAIAAPAFARAHFRDNGYYGEYANGHVVRHRVPRAVYVPPAVYVPRAADFDAEGYRGYVPNNWGSFCGQLAKAC